MTNRFNKKAESLLREAQANGGIGFKELFDLQIAAHDEAVEVANLFTERLDQHCIDIEAKFDSLDCQKGGRHPRRSYDEPDSDFAGVRGAREPEDRRLWLISGIGERLGIPILVAVIVAVLMTYVF